MEIDDPSLPLLSNFVNEHRVLPAIAEHDIEQTPVPSSDLPDLSVLKNDFVQPPSDAACASTNDMPDFSALNMTSDSTNQRLASMEDATKNAESLNDLIQF